MNENNILGVVLAGGKSKRFGQDKNDIKLGNKTLLDHTLHKIKSKFNKIIIVSNKNLKKEYTIVKDCIDGQLGPLVGVLSAMKWIKKIIFLIVGLLHFLVTHLFLIFQLLMNSPKPQSQMIAIYILLKLKKKDITYLVYGL